MNSKICSTCEIEKSIFDFYKDKTHKDGLSSCCKICHNIGVRNWERNNIAKVKQYKISWGKDNPEKRKISSKKWYVTHSEKVKINSRRYRKNNPEKVKVYMPAWRRTHLEQARATHRRYNKKRRTNFINKFLDNIRNNVCKCLKGTKNWQHTEDLLGYTFEQLQKHMQSLWVSGMSWNNYGKGGWHVDHIFPESKLVITGPNDPTFKFLWSLKNLQPLWESDNILKSNIYPWEWEEFKLKYPERLYKHD